MERNWVLYSLLLLLPRMACRCVQPMISITQSVSQSVSQLWSTAQKITKISETLLLLLRLNSITCLCGGGWTLKPFNGARSRMLTLWPPPIAITGSPDIDSGTEPINNVNARHPQPPIRSDPVQVDLRWVGPSVWEGMRMDSLTEQHRATIWYINGVSMGLGSSRTDGLEGSVTTCFEQ